MNYSLSNIVWKYFPVFYGTPFLLATVNIEILARFGELMRWGMLFLAFFLTINFKFIREKKKSQEIYKTDFAAIAFLLLLVGSFSWSIAPKYTFMRGISFSFVYISSFWLLWRYAEQFSGDTLIRLFLYAITCCLGFNLLVGGLAHTEQLFSSRFQGFFVNPNNIGIITCLCIPLGFSNWLKTRRKLDLLILMILVVSLLTAGTRSAMLGSGVAIVAILVSTFVIRPLRAAFISVVGVILLLSFMQTNYFNENIYREETLESASNRTYLWELSKKYIEERPYLGHGFGTDQLIHQHYGISLKELGLRGYGAMSSYYGLAIAIGKPLTFLFYSILIGFTVTSIIQYWKDQYQVTYSATVIGGLIVCIFEPAIYSAGNPFSFLFWACVMLSVKRNRLLRRHVKKARTPKLVRKVT